MLIMVIILAIIIIIVSIYLLAYYCAEDDSDFGTGLICKIIVILGMLVGLGQICLLPLDVSNTRGTGGDFRMDLIWKITYIIIAVFVFFIIPLAISFYECDPEWTFCQKISNGFCFFICELLVVAALFFLTFLFLKKANIPLNSLQCSFDNSLSGNSESEISDNEYNQCDSTKNVDIQINVSLSVYVIALLSFISYILFVIFGGIGIFAFPLDLIYSFCTRPIKLNPHKLEETKKEIVVAAADLKDLAMQIKKLEQKGYNTKSIFSSDRRHYEDLLKRLKVGVSVIDDQYQIIQIQNLANRTSALGYVLQLIAGIICIILSILWIVQIFLYIIIKKNGQPLYPFLNVPLVVLTDNNCSFLAICLFTIFSFYLLICTVKGNVKFGIRLMCLGQIHPLKKDNTYMNSILFNVMLIMFTSVSLIQFCVKAFGEYASSTDADIILNTQIRYLRFYSFFFNYNIFEYVFLVIAFLSFVYLILKPRDTSTMKRILYKKIEDDKKINTMELSQSIEMADKN